MAGADQFDPDPGNNQAAVTVDPAQADLMVTKVASSQKVVVGNQVTFTITVRNLGPNTAANVFLIDLLPAGLAFVSAQPSQGTYQARTGRWAVNTLVLNGSATLRITARVTTVATFRNTAVVSFPGTDPDLSNNTSAVTILGLANGLSKRQLLGSAFR